MPLRALADGTYLVKPPSRNIVQIVTRKGGTRLYTGRPFATPVTLSVAVSAGKNVRLDLNRTQ